MLSNGTASVAVEARMYLFKLFQLRNRLIYFFRPFLCLYVIFQQA
jgi:hypothetical protein